jgi:hypothetical protein
VKASISLGYPTFVYTRPINSQTSPSTKQLCEEFHSIGVTIVEVISFSLDKSLFF